MESRWQALQRKVLNFYDNRPVMAWGCFIVIAALATWHAWAVFLPILSSAEPEQLGYHFLMTTLFTTVGLFMAYCRIQRLEIILSEPGNLSKVFEAHDGPVSPELLDTLRSVADEFGVRGKFETFLAQYDVAAQPTTQVVYNRLVNLAEEAAHEKSH